MQAGFRRVDWKPQAALGQQKDFHRVAAGRGGGTPSPGMNLPPQVREVVRTAFASAVTRIYAYAGALMAASLLVLLALPEIPLRAANPRATAGPPAGAD